MTGVRPDQRRHARPGANRRRVRLAVRGLAAAALTAVLLGCAGEPDGPLRARDPVDVSTPAPVGHEMTWGEVSVINDGDRPVELVRVTVEYPRDGVDLLGVGTAPDDRPTSVGIDEGYPYPQLRKVAREVAGTVVGPGEDVEILVGVAARCPGRWLLRDVAVTYRDRGETRTVRADSRLLVCAPRRTHCDPDQIEEIARRGG